MSDAMLHELLERNDRHVESLAEDYFAKVQSGQKPAVVSVCCSDSRVSQEGMWDVGEPGWIFTASNIGNQVKSADGAGDAISGDVLYPLRFTDTEIAVVVGHTGCGAVTAALERVRADDPEPLPKGIEARVESLVPIVEDGLSTAVDGRCDAGVVDQLVEYNVDRQVEFLRTDGDVSGAVTVAGFVYDFQGVYGDDPGRCYLVNFGGETSTEELRGVVADRFGSSVRRLLE
jgi:carbonic anhydrase